MKTFNICGSCHGPLSDLIQPPSSAQVQVPPKNSGNSLEQTKEKNYTIKPSYKFEKATISSKKCKTFLQTITLHSF